MSVKAGRLTIKEIASAAGVSTQTVSRVINGRPDVAVETREHVQQVIDEMGYRPSAVARSLIKGRSYTLGVVTAGLKFIGPSRTLHGITGTAEEQGYSLILKELPSFDTNGVTPILDSLLSHRVDGIIWAVPEVGNNRDWVCEQFPGITTPMVFLAMEPREDTFVVSIDNYAGGRMAVRHLLEQGYRHIGHVAGPLDWWEAKQRARAWKDVLQEAGLEAGDRCLAEGNWSSASGAQAIEKLVAQYPEMDAVFAGNDQMALGVIEVVGSRGYRIPADLGIVGFDNIAESAYFSPPLTTIQQDQYAIGKVAVEQTIEIIRSRAQGSEPLKPRSIMLSPELVVRESSLREKEVDRG